MPDQRPTVGLAIIARDEEQNLPILLASVAGAFDRVVLLDTGSQDRTKEVFVEWAQGQVGATFAVGKFEWTNDFSAARTAADQLLLFGAAGRVSGPMLVDWTCWADCDDAIVNAEALRPLVTQAPPEVLALIFGYDYAQHPETGACVCHLRRERLVRAGLGRWHGRVHEAQILDGPVQHVADELCHWHHRKQELPETLGVSNARNLKILRAWVKDEPDNARVLAYLGTENAIRGRHKQALSFYRRYLALTETWDEERAQIHRRYAASLIALERWDEAQETALQAIAVLPAWPDSYITLAEVALTRGEPAKALHHAQRVLELGVPDTLLIINPQEYTIHPHRLIAGALGMLGQLDAAVAAAEVVLAAEPGDQNIRNHWARWRVDRQREHTAQTCVLLAEQLIAHDEQLKALEFLEECVPSIAVDHPRVVAIRSMLRERLLWIRTTADFSEHYETGGSKPEDFLNDEVAEQVCQRLPRVAFLLDGLVEQLAA